MKLNKINFKIHIIISIALFFLLLFTKFLFAKIEIYREINLGSVFFLIYGIYLPAIACSFFYNIFNAWKNNLKWQHNLLKFYGLSLLYSIFIGMIFYNNEPTQVIINIPSNITDIFLFILWGGGNILFVLNLFTLFMSVKSLIVAKKENKKYNFGILLIIVSLILLVLTYLSFWITLDFWITGRLPQF